jgi:hypothetical protein
MYALHRLGWNSFQQLCQTICREVLGQTVESFLDSNDAGKDGADAGAWIKLSGWYRLGANEPYATLRPNIERVTAMFGRRMVWGSDWPHTSFLPGHLPSYESTLFPVRSALGEAVLHDVLHLHACSLYFDNHAISP